MPDPIEALILDLLEWIGSTPRPYAEVLEAWRTSCPKLPVWEEANSMGFLNYEHKQGIGYISVSAMGENFLRKARHNKHA